VAASREEENMMGSGVLESGAPPIRSPRHLFSANKLIISAVVFYAGCITFAHAATDDMMMPDEHHTAQAWSKARAFCAKLAARSGYAGDALVIQTCVDKNAWRYDRRT
jgi:hypothetical protein